MRSKEAVATPPTIAGDPSDLNEFFFAAAVPKVTEDDYLNQSVKTSLVDTCLTKEVA
jgi:hypothetical protein